GGILGFGRAIVHIDMDHVVSALVGDGAVLSAGRDFFLAAKSHHLASSNTNSVGGGGISSADADTTVQIFHDTTVDVGSGASIAAERDLDVRAQATFSGSLENFAESGGFAIRPDADADYFVGNDGDRQDTLVHVGADAQIFAKGQAAFNALVETRDPIEVKSTANAYGALADDNADSLLRIHSRATVEVDGGAEITGKDGLTVNAEHKQFF